MKLISKYGWSIVPQDNSFLYYEMNSKGQEIGYFLDILLIIVLLRLIRILILNANMVRGIRTY
ncbi:hypothetical protein [Clostridium uliginosum]|uniref:Uncharacterized protein n=1 Tax=Clostridium uliginosum TaxID=119641 RepID=A0A1I1P660_9CLOT|nr:hypothetical protein [Clostridium uliginosum]SFD05215.1 hypothetical protein SAMN05421842_11816 [Clostridium uliginosum]